MPLHTRQTGTGWVRLFRGTRWPPTLRAHGPVTLALPRLQGLSWRGLSLGHRRRSCLGKCAFLLPCRPQGQPRSARGAPWSPHSLARSPGLQSGPLSQELQHGFPVLAGSLGQLQAKWGTYQVPVPEHTGTKSSLVRRRVPRMAHTWRKKGSTAGRWSENRGIGPFSPIRHVGIFYIPTSDQGLQEQTHPHFLGLTETKSVFLLPLIGTHWI